MFDSCSIRLDFWSVSAKFGDLVRIWSVFLHVVGFFVSNSLICGLLVYDFSNIIWFASNSWPIRFDLWSISVRFGDSRLG